MADIRELVTVDEIMEDMHYGPNGGLIFCMEYLIQNLDWLQDEVGDFDEDYLIFDCPGVCRDFECSRQVPDVLPLLLCHRPD